MYLLLVKVKVGKVEVDKVLWVYCLLDGLDRLFDLIALDVDGRLIHSLEARNDDRVKRFYDVAQLEDVVARDVDGC